MKQDHYLRGSTKPFVITYTRNWKMIHLSLFQGLKPECFLDITEQMLRNGIATWSPPGGCHDCEH